GPSRLCGCTCHPRGIESGEPPARLTRESTGVAAGQYIECATRGSLIENRISPGDLPRNVLKSIGLVETNGRRIRSVAVSSGHPQENVLQIRGFPVTITEVGNAAPASCPVA